MGRTTSGAVRPLASPAEVAEFLGVSVSTLVDWRYRRRGPAWATVGRHVRYRWSDVERWLTAQITEAA
ncbi:hypothetical protein GCM10009557_11460 [Virgisporangium ochraceum]|uniref:Helix-turn-helix domain-containing protein n=1 Tax=Virgisporangium ochraceum TaxID=65505 RepID=A0A8J3ZYP2_9ACTN|nr:hypothetical protein Voc01_048220 [Virgisporangium ochraceum]